MHKKMRISACLLALVATTGSCTNVGLGAATSSLRSTLCPGLVGLEALAWDYYNGVLVTASVLPPPIPVGGFFGHPDFPLLGFSHAPNWTPNIIRDFNTQGVTLIRNDNQAFWRTVFTTAPGIPDVRAVRDSEINQMLAFFGFNGDASQVQTVCLNEVSGERAPGTGIVAAVSNIMVRTPGHTAIIGASVTPFPGGLGQSSIHIRAMAAPTAEFPQRALDSFMAIDWQFLIAKDTSSDRDGDGWLDQFDSAPDNPNVH